jgi:hypothetical protein
MAATDERRRTKPLAGVDLLDRALSDVRAAGLMLPSW